jgi:hypothetical protein
MALFIWKHRADGAFAKSVSILYSNLSTFCEFSQSPNFETRESKCALLTILDFKVELIKLVNSESHSPYYFLVRFVKNGITC